MKDKPHISQELQETRTVPNGFFGGTGRGTNENNLLERLRTVARELPAGELPSFLGELEAVKATAWARLTSPAVLSQPHDELLSVEVAAERLGVSKDYLYRHSEDYPFTRRQGRKLLFSAQGIDKHISQKRS
jgi:excisionase family DNA binding protein